MVIIPYTVVPPKYSHKPQLNLLLPEIDHIAVAS